MFFRRGNVVLCMAVAVGCLPAAVAGGASHELELGIGIGYDSNPFLTPDKPYFDQNRMTILRPARDPAILVPTRISGDLQLPLGQGAHRFVTEYRLKGDFYPDSATSNADETYAKLEPGFHLRLGGARRRESSLDMRAYASYNKEVYFDRDTGLPATFSGFDVSDRYTYSAVGSEVVFEYEVTPVFEVFFEAEGETRRYQDPGTVESFDHDRYLADAGLLFRLPKTVRLSLEYGYQVRDYADRRARSADGEREDSNPLLDYAYTTVTTKLRFKPRQPWTIELGWSLVKRADRFVDYNEYVQDSFRIRSTVKTGRMRWRLSARYREREFDNAFIFDDPVNPATGEPNPSKAYETLELELDGHIRQSKGLRPFARIRYVDQDSADPRFDYRRTQAMTGLEFLY